MQATTCKALVLTVMAGLLVGCATAPASRPEREALLTESASTLQRMRAEDSGVGALVRRGLATPSSYGVQRGPRRRRCPRSGGAVRAGAPYRLLRPDPGDGRLAGRGPELQRAARVREQGGPGPVQGGPAHLCRRCLGRGVEDGGRHRRCPLRGGRRGRGQPHRWSNGRGHHWGPAVHVSGAVSASTPADSAGAPPGLSARVPGGAPAAHVCAHMRTSLCADVVWGHPRR